MRANHYHTVEDLLYDEGFLKWYYQTDENEIKKWNEWLLKSPGNKELADKAVDLLTHVRSGYKKEITDNEINSEVDKLINIVKKLKGYVMSY